LQEHITGKGVADFVIIVSSIQISI